MGAVCCTELFQRGGELDLKMVKSEENNQQIQNGTPTISKELYTSKDKLQGQMGICYSCQVLKIHCECKSVQKLLGDMDDEQIYIHSSRSLDSSSSESRPDDTNTKNDFKASITLYVKYVIIANSNKKKVRFDLTKKQ